MAWSGATVQIGLETGMLIPLEESLKLRQEYQTETHRLYAQPMLRESARVRWFVWLEFLGALVEVGVEGKVPRSLDDWLRFVANHGTTLAYRKPDGRPFWIRGWERPDMKFQIERFGISPAELEAAEPFRRFWEWVHRERVPRPV